MIYALVALNNYTPPNMELLLIAFIFFMGINFDKYNNSEYGQGINIPVTRGGLWIKIQEIGVQTCCLSRTSEAQNQCETS